MDPSLLTGMLIQHILYIGISIDIMGGALSLGKGSIDSASIFHNLNTKVLNESEMIVVDDMVA